MFKVGDKVSCPCENNENIYICTGVSNFEKEKITVNYPIVSKCWFDSGLFILVESVKPDIDYLQIAKDVCGV